MTEELVHDEECAHYVKQEWRRSSVCNWQKHVSACVYAGDGEEL